MESILFILMMAVKDMHLIDIKIISKTSQKQIFLLLYTCIVSMFYARMRHMTVLIMVYRLFLYIYVQLY